MWLSMQPDIRSTVEVVRRGGLVCAACMPAAGRRRMWVALDLSYLIPFLASNGTCRDNHMRQVLHGGIVQPSSPRLTDCTRT